MKKKVEKTPPALTENPPALAENPEPLIARRWVIFEDLRDLGIPMGRNNLREMWEDGDFPKPFRPFGRRLVWKLDEIEAWLKAKEQERV